MRAKRPKIHLARTLAAWKVKLKAIEYTKKERGYAAPKRMETPRGFVFFCGRGKVGGGNNRRIGDKNFESCFTEQRCSVPYFVLLC